MSVRLTFLCGRAARSSGAPASANPHHDWLLGVAWALGWHWPDLDPDQVAQMEAAGWTRATLGDWAGEGRVRG